MDIEAINRMFSDLFYGAATLPVDNDYRYELLVLLDELRRLYLAQCGAWEVPLDDTKGLKPS